MIAYLDCFSGISGDMMLGALLDAGWSAKRLQEVVDSLQLPNVRIQARRVDKASISAMQVEVIAPHEHVHRGRDDLVAMIRKADLTNDVEQQAIAVVDALAHAESRVHDVPVEVIHFHEVGAVDTIVDIVGAVVGLHELGVQRIYCAPLPWSHGTVKAAHGILPVPPPAVAELMKGLPVTGVDIPFELVTPTGVALARTLAEDFGPLPAMQVQQVGYGAGQRDLPNRANVMRLVIGRSTEDEQELKVETLTTLACNLDDMNPEWLGSLVETVLEAGALDIWYTPVQMKKNRPATVVEVLCRPTQAATIRDLLLRHTTTLGVREVSVTRYAVPRHSKVVSTSYGEVRVKIAQLPDGTTRVAPEHDDCAARAAEYGVSVREVWLAAIFNAG